MEELIRKKALEMLHDRNLLYGGLISGRDYQDKVAGIRAEVLEKYGNLGLDAFYMCYKELSNKEVY